MSYRLQQLAAGASHHGEVLASLPCAVQITRFGGPEVLDVVDIAEPEAGPGQKLYDVSTAGVNYADTHQSLS